MLFKRHKFSIQYTLFKIYKNDLKRYEALTLLRTPIWSNWAGLMLNIGVFWCRHCRIVQFCVDYSIRRRLFRTSRFRSEFFTIKGSVHSATFSRVVISCCWIVIRCIVDLVIPKDKIYNLNNQIEGYLLSGEVREGECLRFDWESRSLWYLALLFEISWFPSSSPLSES